MLRFVRAHLVHLLLFPPMILVVTGAHELAHAGMAWVWGARVDHISVLPSPGAWGHMSYTLPEPNPVASRWISLAPYGAGLVTGLMGAVLLMARPWGRFARGTLYVWAVIVPLLEPAYGLLQWARGGDNDLAQALGPPGWTGGLLALVYGAFVLSLGAWIHREAYGDEALSWGGFFGLAGLTSLMMVELA